MNAPRSSSRPRHALDCELSPHVPDASVRAEMSHFYATNRAYAGQQVSHRPEYFRRLAGLMRVVLTAPRLRVLELGAGAAEPLRAWLRDSPGAVAVALDLSSTSLLAATRDPVPGLHAVAGNALQLPFRNDAFDAVVAFEVVEHLPDVTQACEELLRVVRPGGCIVIGLPNHASLWTPMTDGVLGRTRSAFGVTAGRGAWRWWRRNLRLAIRKRWSRRVQFLYRSPILDSGSGGDWDAVYYAAPVDLLRYFRGRGAALITTSTRERMGWMGRLVPTELQGSAVMAWRRPEHLIRQ